jgi:hypothetical protein
MYIKFKNFVFICFILVTYVNTNSNHENPAHIYDNSTKNLSDVGKMYLIDDNGIIQNEPYQFSPEYLWIMARTTYEGEEKEPQCNVFIQYNSSKKRKLVLIPDSQNKKYKISKNDLIYFMRRGTNNLFKIRILQELRDEEKIEQKCNELNKGIKGLKKINKLLKKYKNDPDYKNLMYKRNYSLNFFSYPFATLMPSKIMTINRSNVTLTKITKNLENFLNEKFSLTSNSFKNKQNILQMHSLTNKWRLELKKFCKKYQLDYGKI